MSRELNLVCWNVHLNTFSQDNSYVVETLDSLDEPDVVCLQEYVGGKDKVVREWFDSHDYEIAYLPFAYFPQDKRISQGVMTAFKKLLGASVEPVVLRQDSPQRFRNFPNIRGLLDCKVELEGEEIHIINFHATLPRPYTADMRKREFTELIKYLDEIEPNYSLFLCGDFNFLGRDPRKQQLLRRYSSFTGTRKEPTWRHKTPLKANLDYLFWNKDKLNVKAKLLPFNVSDHRPIVAKLVH